MVKGKPNRQAAAALEPVDRSAADILLPSLDGIDRVIAECSFFLKNADEASPPQKRSRVEGTDNSTTAEPDTQGASVKADLFSAMLSVHLSGLHEAITNLGLQLLPALHEISRRLLILLTTPLLASTEAWELCAVLCLYYRAGASNIVRELVEFLLNHHGVLILDNWCLVHQELSEWMFSTTREGLSAYLSEGNNFEAVVERTERKLRSFRYMLLAAGDSIPSEVLQAFAFRFSHEMIEEGMGLVSRESEEVRIAIQALDRGSAQPVHWHLLCEWKAECLLILDTMVAQLRVVDPSLLSCCSAAVERAFETCHRGFQVVPTRLMMEHKEDIDLAISSAPIAAAILAAATQLSHSVRLITYPAVIPLKPSAEALVVQPRQRRIFVEVETPSPLLFGIEETHSVAVTEALPAVVAPPPAVVAPPPSVHSVQPLSQSVSVAPPAPPPAPRQTLVAHQEKSKPAAAAPLHTHSDDIDLPEIDLND